MRTLSSGSDFFAPTSDFIHFPEPPIQRTRTSKGNAVYPAEGRKAEGTEKNSIQIKDLGATANEAIIKLESQS